MQVKIVVESEDGDGSLTSLYRWLAEDPEVTRDASVLPVATPPGAGEMGGAFEVINAVLTHAIALGGLAVSCAAWRASRTHAPVIRIERDGVTVTVENDSPDTVRRVIDALGDPAPQAGQEDDPVADEAQSSVDGHEPGPG
ncbi:effector-associated constant component EACC1 [Streptomyces olivaceoviridis]|uniref:effector-associated constant component EACC1 n=1 Tax=Streptomyces olivaceoviridis TaxID=1921 RepID=UPI0036CFB42C